MELGKEPAARGRKRMIGAVLFGFMGLLLFFTLFSNTLQSMTLPKVRTETPTKGSIAFTFEGSGSLQPYAQAQLTNPAGWKVAKIHVKEGDRVKKGQRLITYDSASAEQELEDETTSLNKQRLELQSLQDQYIESVQEGNELKRRDADRALNAFKLDLSAQERKIKRLKESLARERELDAPFGGVIAKLNAVEGLASAGQPDVLISNAGEGFRLGFSADSALLSGMGIAIGEKVEVEVRAVQDQSARMVEGTVAEIADAEPLAASPAGEETGTPEAIPRKTLVVKLADPKLKGGEQARIKLGKPSSREGWIVSNEAIHRDGDESYLFRIEERPGALGNVFVARKARIQSSETNGRETMIQSDSLYENDMIVLESGEPLQDGNRVRLH